MKIINKIRKDAKIFAQIGVVLSLLYAFLNILLLSFVLVSCDIDDERDICCESLRIDFRYSKGGADLFPQHIRSMKHYVFDANGQLYTVIEGSKNDLQHLSLGRVPVGVYSLVSLANLGKATLLEPNESQITKTQFLLKLQNLRADNFMANGDLLYWGILNFEAIKNERLRYLCDMSNIHCRMTITLRWKGKVPGGKEPYTFELNGIPAEYNLNIDKAYAIHVAGDKKELVTTNSRVVHSFPKVEENKNLVNHRKEAPYLAGRVRVKIVSLRYTETRIPKLRIYHKGLPITKEMDLAKAFKIWKWETDNNIEQDYKIDVEIQEDGTVIIKPTASVNVKDWIDGGSI